MWKKALDEIELEVSENTFNSFFKSTKILEFSGSNLIISCPNSGVGFFLQSKYQMLIARMIEKYTGQRPKKILFQSVNNQAKSSKSIGPLFSDEPESVDFKLQKAGLSPNLSFENFAVSVSNQLAHAAALAVASNPGKTYNPLFLWGGVGVGKTHLLNAVGRKIIETIGGSVYYCSTEDFMNSLVESIKNKRTDSFRKRFRNIDALLLDDIQFVSEREFVQEELFHTFNKLRNANKQIIFTSDKPPKLIPKIEKRLASRFLSGLVVDIQVPDFELKTAILLIKAREKNVPIDVGVAKIISANIEEIREAEGFLLKLRALQESGTEIKKELIERLIVQSEGARVVNHNPREIIKIAARELNVKLKDIKEDNRKQNVAMARHIIMYFLKTLTNLPYEDIALLLGKKDHTTVMHGVQKVMNQIPNDDILRRKVETIKNYFV